MFAPDFIIVPYVLVADEQVRPLDERVYGIIYWMTCMKGEKCFASNDSLARMALSSKASVANSLSRLEKLGYIERIFTDKNRSQIVPLVRMGVNHTVKGGSSGGEGGVNHTVNRIRSTLTRTVNDIHSATDKSVAVDKPVHKPKKPNEPYQIVEYFIYAKGWTKETLPGRTFSSYLRAAKDLIDATGSVDAAKSKIDMVRKWADDRELSWSLETIFRKWHELENPSEMKKRAFIGPDRAYQRNGDWYVIISTGEHKKYAGPLSSIEYR